MAMRLGSLDDVMIMTEWTEDKRKLDVVAKISTGRALIANTSLFTSLAFSASPA